MVIEVFGSGGINAEEGPDDGSETDLTLLDAVVLVSGVGRGVEAVVASGVDVEVVGVEGIGWRVGRGGRNKEGRRQAA